MRRVKDVLGCVCIAAAVLLVDYGLIKLEGVSPLAFWIIVCLALVLLPVWCHAWVRYGRGRL